MTDNEKKEFAERLRNLIDGTSNGIVLSAALQDIADELDPPRPEPGTVVWRPGMDPIIKMDLKMEDVRVDTYRTKGQRLNEQNSGVRMTHNPTGIVVQCQSERGQHKNRAVAITMLKSRLYEYYTGVDDEV